MKTLRKTPDIDMKKHVATVVTAVIALGTCACTRFGSDPVEGDSSIVLTPSAKVITLDPSLETAEVLAFTWTPGSNQKTGAGISYTFEMCVKGDAFQHAWTYEIGKTSYRNFSFISSIEDSKSGAVSLYAILEEWQNDLSIPDAVRPVTGKPCTVQARIVASVYHSDIAPVASEPAEVEIAPAIYMIGGATSGGWSLDKAAKLAYQGNGKYHIRYDFESGQIKFPYGTLYFADGSGNFDNCYVAESDNQPVSESTSATLEKSSLNAKTDNKFYISKSGYWDIILDVKGMNVQFAYDSESPASKKNLYIVGPATGNGWDWPGSAQTFEIVSDNHYRLSGRLVTGEFKLLRNAGSWTPAFTATDREDREKMVFNDNNDIKFVIDRTGSWILNVNTEELTILYQFDPDSQEPYDALWMIGDASPGGWSVDSDKATPMTKTGENIFSWSGTLKAGELKFPVAVNHFKWSFGAKSAGSTDLVYNPDSGTDHKINVAAAGDYTVTVNLNTMKCTLNAN